MSPLRRWLTVVLGLSVGFVAVRVWRLRARPDAVVPWTWDEAHLPLDQ